MARLVAPAFTARRAAEFRPRMESIVERLLDELPGHAEDGVVDLLPHFARPLPMEVICEIGGVPIGRGARVTAAIVSANRDPRAFADPDRLDVSRTPVSPGHLGFAHGAHFCLGAALARVQTEVALGALLRRHPDLALAVTRRTSRAPPTAAPGDSRPSS
ncbi:cytochrome P450 [Solihabitans fulvus]|uniref:cytochrome P450 n=1 Tax=Solihabitans fulvus TaxID=1892852 RepID=UPI003F67756E